ncbi:zinc finger protein 438 isoform X2 [Neoarius graeffei]|nr:zinc finger protein 438 isoform X2 [Neoarius graeffei]XP_060796097.1 zinc finger protein 438 isoform X2 [Neoarius graeffei]XP_060796098.1 zinc finger protein 438 isoform X2 [Neoarius graeffei]XP_060796099.1 zinc finger protein 438 isoform X2 [Neoarius graeffei]XP_060796100.1 zinc finger protein 438 isoform X2 [Neoarius graeffei]
MAAMKTQEQRSSPLKSPIQNDSRPIAQSKAVQFRTIAPKAPTLGSSSAVISSQPPTNLPEASTAVSPKSILVPAQNYALMQVAGQEGTFSLVALPQTSPQSQIQNNLKLPIPRYQSVRSQRASEKANSKNSVKVAKFSQAKCAVKTNLDVSSLPETSESSSEQIVGMGSASSSEVLLPDNAVLCTASRKEQAVKRCTENFSYSTSTSATALVAPVSNSKTIKTQTEGASAGSAITVLSPTIFSKAVQIIPSPPKGKLPILPYAKVKNSLLPSPGLASTQSPVKVSSVQAKNKPKSSPDIKGMVADSRTRSVNTTHCKKPTGKRRGRKRKTMEDILSFEAKKKRSLSFFSRRVPEKPTPGTQSSSSHDKVVDISKKYRSIRPKPILVMETTVPRLVPLASLSSSKNPDQKLLMEQMSSGKALGTVQPALLSIPAPGQQSMAETGNCGRFAYVGSRALHRCTTCSRCFQFKHHLQSHMNSHSNLRPYGCPVCRKAYAHSGSLSTHMKLHHSEGRPRKSLRCEFCEKAFGYVGVYFSHLREVHRVILTVEPSIRQHEENTPIEGCVDSEDQTSEHRVDPVELQIKCGRCQAITPTFADMKLHLLYVHGEEVQVHLKEGAMHEGREAENELVKHAAHYWRQLNERRNLVRCGSCDEEFFSFSKLECHLHAHHQGVITSQEDERELKKEEDVSERSDKSVTLRAGSKFNCILCSGVLNSKQEVLEHWKEVHKCENPVMLWEVLDSK